MNAPRLGGADLVSVPRESYLRMCRESNELMALRAIGVHEWEGYRDAMRLARGPAGGDGLAFCKSCGGPYSGHHDCKCGECAE